MAERGPRSRDGWRTGQGGQPGRDPGRQGAPCTASTDERDRHRQADDHRQPARPGNRQVREATEAGGPGDRAGGPAGRGRSRAVAEASGTGPRARSADAGSGDAPSAPTRSRSAGASTTRREPALSAGIDPADELDRVAGLDQAEERGGFTGQDDPSGRAPVVEREPVAHERRRRGRRRGPARPTCSPSWLSSTDATGRPAAVPARRHGRVDHGVGRPLGDPALDAAAPDAVGRRRSELARCRPASAGPRRTVGPRRPDTAGGRSRRPSPDDPRRASSRAILAPGSPLITTRVEPTRISARQRSPELVDVDDRSGDPDEPPLDRDRRRAGQGPRGGQGRRPEVGHGARPDPRRVVRTPDLADDPQAMARAMARSHRSAGGPRSPAVASWMTIRRPVASSRLAGTVTTPTTETVRPWRASARAIDTLDGLVGPELGAGRRGRRRRRGRPGGRCRPGRAATAGSRPGRPSARHAGRRSRSAGSGARRRGPRRRSRSSRPTSTRARSPASSTTHRARPPADFVGACSTMPVRVTSRPSVASPSSADPTAAGAGSGIRVASGTIPPTVVRISSWPYGSASVPLTTSRSPRAGRATSVGQPDEDAAGVIAEGEQRGRPEPAGLGRHDPADAHRRPHGQRPNGRDRAVRPGSRWPSGIGVAVGVGAGGRGRAGRRCGGRRRRGCRRGGGRG